MEIGKSRSEQHSDLKDLVKYVGLAACSATFVFSLASPPSFLREIKFIPYPQKLERTNFDLHVGKGIPDSDRYMKSDGRWDLDRLRARQNDYFDFLRTHYQDTVFNGMPYSIIQLMPTIKRISEEHDVDPNVITSIIQIGVFRMQVCGRKT